MKALTAAEMREVDRLTTELFGIPGSQLMENAGRAAADAVWSRIAGRGVNDKVRVTVLCGKGNNGGDGFVVARHLKEQKLATRVVLFGKRRRSRGGRKKSDEMAGSRRGSRGRGRRGGLGTGMERSA